MSRLKFKKNLTKKNIEFAPSIDPRMRLPKLGVNIDHVATLRQLRGTPYPDLLEAAKAVEKAGAHQITVHLREDRRHIQDADVVMLKKKLNLILNLEMALSDEIVKFALKVKPDWVCLVPEKRNEVTTEGGLNVKGHQKKLETLIPKFQKAGIRVSLFIEPDSKIVKLSHDLGADAVELHTGKYCDAYRGQFGKKSTAICKKEFLRIKEAATLGRSLGIKVHAGHGFCLESVRDVTRLDLIEEYNIGHFLVARSVHVGLEVAVREMLSAVHAP